MDAHSRPAVLSIVKRAPFLLVLLLVLVSCKDSPTDPFGERSARLSGIVTDQHGNIWGGVTIGLVGAEGTVAADGKTDDHGRYSISHLHPGQYHVWLQLGRTGPGYFVDDVILRDGLNTLDIVSR
jgi:hypothetical protein